MAAANMKLLRRSSQQAGTNQIVLAKGGLQITKLQDAKMSNSRTLAHLAYTDVSVAKALNAQQGG